MLGKNIKIKTMCLPENIESDQQNKNDDQTVIEFYN